MYGVTFQQILWYFVIYSILGWIVEVAYHAVTMGKVVNRGYLNGPLCPVYGCGMLIVLALVIVLSRGDIDSLSLWAVFGIGAFFATAAELIAGWLRDKLFHARWWDYSGEHFNLHGYICLKFCLIWGAAITFGVRLVHPTVESVTEKLLSHSWTMFLLIGVYAVLIADIVVSSLIAHGIDKQLHELDGAAKALRALSDPASAAITEGTLRVVQPMQKGRVQAALAKAELRDSAQEMREDIQENMRQLKQRQEKLYAWFTGNAWFGRKRMIHAFPTLRHERYQEAAENLRSRLRQ